MGQIKCPYNELHYSQVNEHQAHLKECPDRDSKIDGSQSLRSGGEEARENALVLSLYCTENTQAVDTNGRTQAPVWSTSFGGRIELV